MAPCLACAACGTQAAAPPTTKAPRDRDGAVKAARAEIARIYPGGDCHAVGSATILTSYATLPIAVLAIPSSAVA